MKSFRMLLAFVLVLSAAASITRCDEAIADVAGRTLEEWSSELKSPTPVVRRRAVLAIGAFGKNAVPVLTQALSHDDDVVRYWAASELGDLGGDAKPAVESLRKMLGEKSIGVRIAAAYALCRVGLVDEGLLKLLEGLKHKDRGVWNASADFLARIGPPAKDAVATLEAEGKRGDDHIADICNEALRRIRGVEPSLPSKTTNATQGDAASGKPNKKVTAASVFSKAFLDEDVSRFSKPNSDKKRPNILLISAEDISPNLGCYGDSYAITPRLDQLASEGMRFSRCFTHAGVCAISRSGLITGMYPVSIGSQHMRSQIVLPPHVKAFPEYLRAAGYWTTNRSKTDYNFPPPKAAWDENSPQSRDWRGRRAGQPFFSVINLVTTHESQIRGKFVETLHDPAKAQLPPYIPDTPVTRRDWARYADLLTTLDQQVATILDQLAADGLAEETIVCFWGDHGQGLPRGKRWLYDSGTRTPLIIRWPGKLAAGSVCDDLVCFLDFAPTMLKLAEVEVPSHLHGRVLPPIENVIASDKSSSSPLPSREFIFGHRDRMDETYDLIRSARDTRFKYIRNYAPRRPYSQNITYMNQMPSMREMRRLNVEGQLSGAVVQFFRETKPVEELFDTEADPHEIVNLADRPEHAATLNRMRAALERWQEEVDDSGLIPEPLLGTPLMRR
ncbi:MAG: sulfatase-like hydrolase/transferase [Planctomycetia bacterium]|nr:sulfatase-like hydrolase/transferase [Planctomycetia bacterium]